MVESFSCEKLEVLEGFYLDKLENVKQIRFRRKHDGEMRNIIERLRVKPQLDIWQVLKVDNLYREAGRKPRSVIVAKVVL